MPIVAERQRRLLLPPLLVLPEALEGVDPLVGVLVGVLVAPLGLLVAPLVDLLLVVLLVALLGAVLVLVLVLVPVLVELALSALLDCLCRLSRRQTPGATCPTNQRSFILRTWCPMRAWWGSLRTAAPTGW